VRRAKISPDCLCHSEEKAARESGLKMALLFSTSSRVIK